MFSSRFVCVVALCGALFNIEYSVARAAETEVAPMATPTPMATPVPLRKPVIDARAQLLLRQMAAAYAKLSSFSCVVNVNAIAGKETEKIRASIAWQTPNRFAFLVMKNGSAKRMVSNGQFLFGRNSTKPDQYTKIAVPRRAALQSALKIGEADDLLLSNVGRAVTNLTSPAFQKTDQVILRFGSESESRFWPGADVVMIEGLPEGKPARAQFVIDRKSHLLRQIKLNGVEGDTAVTWNETYSNVRFNPALPASTFAFKPRPSDKLFVPTAPTKAEPQRFDPRLKVGATPLAFAAKDLDGNAISPAKYRGRVLLLDFWATWCGPCVNELPAIKAAYDKYHAQGFDIVGISFDNDKKTLTDFLIERKMAWPQVFDCKGWNAAVGKTYGVRSIPFTVLIGRDGKIAALNLRGAALEMAVKAALAKK